MSRLVNVAVNRPALQSSTSQWSKPDDAGRAVSSALHARGGFAFCTSVEATPFWSVDLQSEFRIRRITVFNREDTAADRSCPLIIETSVTGQAWSEICTVRYVFGGAITDTPLDICLKEPIEARHVRLRRIGDARHFHLDRVEVYTGIDDIQSCAQLSQDLWVIRMTGGRSGGHFVEIGSTNGVNINNTYLLESRFGWRGACVEPNPRYYEELARNRTAKTFRRAVFPEGGKKLNFVADDEFGALLGFEASDFHADRRAAFMSSNTVMEVETISPNELFEAAALPPLIDYLSLDTEGSEWDILKSVDFSRYRFGLLTIEHNFVSEKRELIYALLKNLGYYRISAKWDDWYYHPIYLEILNGAEKIDFNALICDIMTEYQYGKEQF